MEEANRLGTELMTKTRPEREHIRQLYWFISVNLAQI